ncbi:MAG TPA: hypothetical protein VMF13_04500 [Luteitalea sp.]|nr:hypothetical protein [Luteitalea sp.]
MDSVGPLQDWLRGQLASGLPALAGARVSGRVPLQVELLNELIAGALSSAAQPREASVAGPRPALPVDVARLVKHVRHLRVDAAPGTVTLDFEIGVDG